MIADPREPDHTVALSTKVEEDFIQPLAAVRSSLEILRDYADLSAMERQRFVGSALRGCERLEQGVGDLSRSVYAAGAVERRSFAPDPDTPHVDRISVHEDLELIDIDFSGYEFRDSEMVNEFHNAIESVVRASGRNWYFTINHEDCHVWPEAWIAFAHRGKKITATCSLGTVRYGQQPSDPDYVPSREAAFAQIAEMRAQGGGRAIT